MHIVLYICIQYRREGVAERPLITQNKYVYIYGPSTIIFNYNFKKQYLLHRKLTPSVLIMYSINMSLKS